MPFLYFSYGMKNLNSPNKVGKCSVDLSFWMEQCLLKNYGFIYNILCARSIFWHLRGPYVGKIFFFSNPWYELLRLWRFKICIKKYMVWIDFPGPAKDLLWPHIYPKIIKIKKASKYCPFLFKFDIVIL